VEENLTLAADSRTLLVIGLIDPWLAELAQSSRSRTT